MAEQPPVSSAADAPPPASLHRALAAAINGAAGDAGSPNPHEAAIGKMRQAGVSKADQQRPTYDVGPLAGSPVEDMIRSGDTDVNHLPGITNADGSHSSIFSMTIPVDKNGNVWKGDYNKAPAYALVPSIANGKFLTPDGKIPPLADRDDKELTPAQRVAKRQQVGALEDAATKHYAQTRHQLGIFASSDAADKYATATHAYTPDGTDRKVFAPSYEADEHGEPVKKPSSKPSPLGAKAILGGESPDNGQSVMGEPPPPLSFDAGRQGTWDPNSPDLARLSAMLNGTAPSN